MLLGFECPGCGVARPGETEAERQAELARPCGNPDCPSRQPAARAMSGLDQEVRREEGFLKGRSALVKKIEGLIDGLGFGRPSSALACVLWRLIRKQPPFASCVDRALSEILIRDGGKTIETRVRLFPEHAGEEICLDCERVLSACRCNGEPVLPEEPRERKPYEPPAIVESRVLMLEKRAPAVSLVQAVQRIRQEFDRMALERESLPEWERVIDLDTLIRVWPDNLRCQGVMGDAPKHTRAVGLLLELMAMKEGQVSPGYVGCRYERGKHLGFSRKGLIGAIYACECDRCVPAVTALVDGQVPREDSISERVRLCLTRSQ